MRRAKKIRGLLEMTLFVCTALVLAGCTVVEIPAPKQFECEWAQDKEHWTCASIATGKSFKCEYTYGTSIDGTDG